MNLLEVQFESYQGKDVDVKGVGAENELAGFSKVETLLEMKGIVEKSECDLNILRNRHGNFKESRKLQHKFQARFKYHPSIPNSLLL
jgi:hypothetical protein